MPTSIALLVFVVSIEGLPFKLIPLEFMDGSKPSVRLPDFTQTPSNAASKLGEDTAEAHEILVTGGLKDAVGDAVPAVSFNEVQLEIPGADRTYQTIYPSALAGV